MSDDVRAIIDPIAAILAARPKFRTVPGSTYQPPAQEEGDPLPPPVVSPPRMELYTDAAELPGIVTENGLVNIGGQLSLIQSALAWIWGEMQIRSVSGRASISGIHAAGSSERYPITWDQVTPKPPTGGDVQFQGVASVWAGRMFGYIESGSETTTGAVLVVKFLQAVVISAGNPLSAEVKGMFLYVPPFTP